MRYVRYEVVCAPDAVDRETKFAVSVSELWPIRYTGLSLPDPSRHMSPTFTSRICIRTTPAAPFAAPTAGLGESDPAFVFSTSTAAAAAAPGEPRAEPDGLQYTCASGGKHPPSSGGSTPFSTHAGGGSDGRSVGALVGESV